MSAKRQETRHRSFRHVAAGPARLPALYGMRATLPARVEATAGHAELHGAERNPQWRYKPRTQSASASRLDKSRQHRGSGVRATGSAANPTDQAGRQERLQPMGGHAVPARLRPEESRSGGGFLHLFRLDASRHEGGADADRARSRNLEACAQEQFGMSRHGTKSGSLFRHGTKSKPETRRIAKFVPPRNETPCFSGLGCPARGHLSRYAICTEYEEREVR